MAEKVRDVEHEPGEQDAEHRKQERVLDRGVGRERDRVLLGLRGSMPSGLFCPATCSAQTCSTTTPTITNGSR